MPFTGPADVKAALIEYGIPNPTDAEINLFSGLDSIGGGASAAVAEYANFVKREQERQAADPLKSYQDLEQKFADDSFAQAQNLYTQLQSTLSDSPKLFGSLSPEQIDAYIAPLKTSFDKSLADVQGVIASRGITGSSTENNALAQTGQQFKENVLATGLQVGLDAQKQKAQSISDQISRLFSSGTAASGMVGQAAGQRSSQDLAQSNLIASLPYFLRSSATAEAQARISSDQATANQDSFAAKFNSITGMINTGINTFGNVATFGKNISTPFGGVSNTPTNGNSPSVPASSGNPMGFSGSKLNAPGYDASRFQSTGSLFE